MILQPFRSTYDRIGQLSSSQQQFLSPTLTGNHRVINHWMANFELKYQANVLILSLEDSLLLYSQCRSRVAHLLHQEGQKRISPFQKRKEGHSMEVTQIRSEL